METTSIYFIAGAIVVLVVVIIGILSFVSRQYTKVPPNKVAVFYGRKNKIQVEGKDVIKGFKVVTGGAKFKIPLLEDVEFLDLSVISIDVQVIDAPNADGVPVTLKAVANVKIKPDEASLMAACERFLGKTPEEIKQIAHKNLEGHLRSIAGRMTIEALVGDRAKLNSEVLNDAATDLIKMGLGVDLLTVSEVTDKNGYIDQLGKKRTAEIVRDAQIGTAEANKESRIKTTTAEKEGVMVANSNQVLIAESDKDRDVKKADYKALVETQNAIANNAGPISEAQQQQTVVAEETKVEKVRAEKLTEVAEAKALQTEKELISTVIKPAEANKKGDIIKAEATKQVSINEAEGEAQAMQIMAEANKQKQTKEGEGAAAAVLAKLAAEAEGRKLMLLAEAEGILKKAEAYEKLDQTGKLLQILEVVERVLPEVVKEFSGVMKAAAEPLSNIKEVKIIDFGGNGQTGGSAITRFGQIAPEMVMKFVAALKAAGIDPTDLFSKVGIDLGTVFGEAKTDTKGKTDTTKKPGDDKK